MLDRELVKEIKKSKSRRENVKVFSAALKKRKIYGKYF